MRPAWPALHTWIALAVFTGSLSAHAQQIPPTLQGTSLADSSQHKIVTGDGSKFTVVVFLSARCPCSASHEPALAALATEFGKDANFVGIHSNSDEPIPESVAHFKAAALPFPVLQDSDAHLAGLFGAVKTPHVYILGKDGKVLYQGGVDNSHTATDATKPYLKSALTSLRSGQNPEVALARAIGCVIRR